MKTPSLLATAAFATLLVSALLVLSDDAEASHYRYGTLNWEPTGAPNEVQFGGEMAWALSAGFPGTCPAPPTPPVIGCINEVGWINPGDASPQMLAIQITDFSVAENWKRGTIVTPAGLPLVHTYATPNDAGSPWVATWTGCCRITIDAVASYEHMNNPFEGQRLETLVDLGGVLGTGVLENSSPVTSMPPIVRCPTIERTQPVPPTATSYLPSSPPPTVSQTNPFQQLNTVCTFNIPSTDPDADAATYRMATPAEAGSTTFDQPPGAMIDPVSGQYVWDFGLAPRSTLYCQTVYSTQVVIEDQWTKTPVDFMIMIPSTSPPGSPSGVGAAITGDQLGAEVTWTSPSAPANCPIRSYNIYRSPDTTFSNALLIGSVTAPTLDYEDKPLPPCVPFYYWVTAVSDGGESPPGGPATYAHNPLGLPSPCQGTPPGCTGSPPAAPTGVAATSLPPTGARITWTAPAPVPCPIEEYNVYRGVTPTFTAATWIGTVPDPTTFYDDDPIAPCVDYWYWVTAVSDPGEGPPGGPATFTYGSCSVGPLPSCPPGSTGLTPPACTAPCPPPGVGTQPVCVPVSPCGFYEVGIYPYCVRICPPPTVGLPPHCVGGPCPSGEVGLDPACVDPCPPPELGIEPLCVELCPPPKVGIARNCVDPCPTMPVPGGGMAQSMSSNGKTLSPGAAVPTSGTPTAAAPMDSSLTALALVDPVLPCSIPTPKCDDLYWMPWVCDLDPPCLGKDPHVDFLDASLSTKATVPLIGGSTQILRMPGSGTMLNLECVPDPCSVSLYYAVSSTALDPCVLPPIPDPCVLLGGMQTVVESHDTQTYQQNGALRLSGTPAAMALTADQSNLLVGTLKLSILDCIPAVCPGGVATCLPPVCQASSGSQLFALDPHALKAQRSWNVPGYIVDVEPIDVSRVALVTVDPCTPGGTGGVGSGAGDVHIFDLDLGTIVDTHALPGAPLAALAIGTEPGLADGLQVHTYAGGLGTTRTQTTYLDLVGGGLTGQSPSPLLLDASTQYPAVDTVVAASSNDHALAVLDSRGVQQSSLPLPGSPRALAVQGNGDGVLVAWVR